MIWWLTPKQLYGRVYEHFGFTMSHRFENRLMRQTRRANKRAKKRKVKYSLEEMGLTEQEIAVQFGDVMRKFKFPGGEVQRPRVRRRLRRQEKRAMRHAIKEQRREMKRRVRRSRRAMKRPMKDLM